MKNKILFVMAFLFTGFNAVAGNYETTYNKLNKNDKNIVDKVNNYFDYTKTFKSNFIQFNQTDGSISEGTVNIEKPNKIRFEYTNPFRTLFIKNKNIINYYDIDLDEIVIVPQSVNPIFDILSKQDNLKKLDSKIISIKEIEENSGDYIIETEIKINDMEIKLTYIFDENIEQLTNLKINAGEEIELNFFKSERNIILDKKIFVFDNPRLFNKKKEKIK